MNAWQHEPFHWAPEKKLGGGWLCFKSSPSPPPAPDYSGAATATAAGNKDNSIAAQQGSMVNQDTPYGSLNYSQTGTSAQGNPTYTANYSLSPTGQSLLDNANRTQTQLSGLQQGAETNVANTYARPMDQSSVQATADQAYKNYTARLDPQWNAREGSERAMLANQGVAAGGEAYNNEMRDFNNARDDAYTQANTAAIGTMPQTYQLAAAQRNQPLNELNALMTGSQVTNPQFSAQPGQQAVPGANYLGAAQMGGQYAQGLYNSQVGQANSFNGGLVQAGGALGGAMIAASDRRLKSNVKRIGTHPLGIGVYEYDIFGHRETGVMAQELFHVKPSAVLQHPSGYLMVDYAQL